MLDALQNNLSPPHFLNRGADIAQKATKLMLSHHSVTSEAYDVTCKIQLIIRCLRTSMAYTLLEINLAAQRAAFEDW